MPSNTARCSCLKSLALMHSVLFNQILNPSFKYAVLYLLRRPLSKNTCSEEKI